MFYTAASVQNNDLLYVPHLRMVKTHKVETLSRPRTEQPSTELFRESGEYVWNR